MTIPETPTPENIKPVLNAMLGCQYQTEWDDFWTWEIIFRDQFTRLDQRAREEYTIIYVPVP